MLLKPNIMNVTFALESSFSAAKLPFNDSGKMASGLGDKGNSGNYHNSAMQQGISDCAECQASKRKDYS